KPQLVFERVWRGGKTVLNRPTPEDEADKLRLTQTHLEQINSNEAFRSIAKSLESLAYLHVVPQLVRHPKAFAGRGIPGDPFGQSFLERIGKTPEKTRNARLRKIEQALRFAVPQLKQLGYVVDSPEGGVPHLEALYDHWRPHGAKQRESEFSDGTLRLIGMFWALLDGNSPLLLEEPELSLNSAIVRKLPALIHRLTRKSRRQVFISTHSHDLLSDRGIGAEEILLLTPGAEGTVVQVGSDNNEVRALLESGLSPAEVALPRVEPSGVEQLLLFE
ncbi:MAG TPA: AAA family ATPase, partial [Phycisphaerae bacterium]|nr:AAA family ATPase [Phycisphaerae bacterium]